ncbi:MAG: DUF1592 domain-containing protein [Verrucomicrobiota bacterium]
MKTYCASCHGGDDPDAGLDILSISPNLYEGEDATMWQEIVDRLNLGEMPPPDEPQPKADELAAVVDWIQGGLREARTLNLRSGGAPVLRRFNRHEYSNTIRDLLHLRNYDPGPRFPEDAKAFGFDNNRSALTMSPLLMERYLEIASEAVDRAIRIGDQPKPTNQRFDAVEFATDRMKNKYWQPSVVAGKWWVVHENRLAVRGRGVRTDIGGGFNVPHDGEYIFRMRIASIVGKDGTVPEVLVRLTNAEQSRDIAHLSVSNKDLKNQDLRVFLRKGRVEFRLTFANGQPLKKTAKELDEVLVPGDEGYQGEPHSLLCETVSLIGPVIEQWPPKSYTSIFGEAVVDSKSEDDAEEILSRFCQLAFRSRIVPSEVAPFVAIYRDARREDASFKGAIGHAMKAILCSPRFVFLVEHPDESEPTETINQHELATRLSYLLWSSMPDEELRNLAEQGRLRDPSALDQQVERMLRDPKSDAFVENFFGHWLGLPELGAMRPSARLNREYFDHRIEEQSRQETLRFCRELLDQNESILNFIDSDFTILNGPLAKWYGIDGIAGPEFRRVTLPDGSPRGGVLTQASVLTLTSDGTRTKPVTRGTWILTNIIGSPPPPPPPNAGDLPVIPDKPLTVRERLDHHRRIPACATCHRKIDPMGFALDNFDMLGRYRTEELSENGKRPVGEIDPSGRLPDGREFETLNQFKQLLLDDRERFARCLTEKMMTYALGRGLEFPDRASVDSVLTQLEDDDYRIQSLIKGIVQSQPASPLSPFVCPAGKGWFCETFS